jgi:hypothetical protein
MCAEDDRVIDIKTSGKPLDARLSLRWIGDSDDLQTFFTVLTLQSYQVGHLYTAWWTPGGPKVDKHYFPAIVAQPHGAAVNVPTFELRRFGLLPQNACGRKGDHQCGKYNSW